MSSPSSSPQRPTAVPEPGAFAALEAVTVPTADGTTFTLRVHAADDPTAPVLLVLPAMAMKAKSYARLLAALRAAGVSAVSTDLRGQGESRPVLTPAARFGYRELVEVDLPAVVEAVHHRFPDAPVFLFGHSLGGQLALLHTARVPEGVSGVAVIGTGSVYFRAFAQRWFEALWKIQTIGLRSWWSGHWPGGMLIGGPMAGRVMTDWARHSRTGRYRPAGSRVPYDRLLARLEHPVLVISLDDDPLGPRSTVDVLAGRLRAAAVTRRHLDEDSGVTHLDHFAWIRDSDVIAPMVADWARSVRPAS